jgi:hypothetical protein
MPEQRQFKQMESLKERLGTFAKDMREKAARLSGPERDDLLTKARQADTASHLDDWANSTGLQRPK